MKQSFFQWAWSCPKQGNTDAENEDAWRTVVVQDTSASTVLLTVADGATEGVYSRAWANALVNAVMPEWPQLSDTELTARLQQLRQSYQPLPPGQEMAWNVKTKWMTEGSCATLLVATISATTEGIEVQAVGIGDCCLLVLRADGSTLAFPLEHSADFNTSPMLVRSLFQPQLEYRRLAPTPLAVGDIVLVCTDAIGKWALQCVEEGATELLLKSILELLPTESVAAATNINTAPPSEPLRVELDSSVTRRRIIPRWKVPAFVESWWPKKNEVPIVPTTTKLNAPESPAIEKQPSFADWVAQAQAPENTPRMKNDDTTLVLCAPLAAEDDSLLQTIQAKLRR